jgi:hypothetical protein
LAVSHAVVIVAEHYGIIQKRGFLFSSIERMIADLTPLRFPEQHLLFVDDPKFTCSTWCRTKEHLVHSPADMIGTIPV